MKKTKEQIQKKRELKKRQLHFLAIDDTVLK